MSESGVAERIAGFLRPSPERQRQILVSQIRSGLTRYQKVRDALDKAGELSYRVIEEAGWGVYRDAKELFKSHHPAAKTYVKAYKEAQRAQNRLCRSFPDQSYSAIENRLRAGFGNWAREDPSATEKKAI